LRGLGAILARHKDSCERETFSGEHRGAMVITTEVSPDAIKEGDIIEFRQGEMMVIHRVIEIEESGGAKQFITKGDANDNPDMDPVSPEQVKGRVMLNVPRLGWITLFFRSG